MIVEHQELMERRWQLQASISATREQALARGRDHFPRSPVTSREAPGQPGEHTKASQALRLAFAGLRTPSKPAAAKHGTWGPKP